MSLRLKLVNNGKYNVFVIEDDEYIGNAISKGHEWDAWMRRDLEKYYVEGTEILDIGANIGYNTLMFSCLLYTSPSPRDYAASRMPSSA